MSSKAPDRRRPKWLTLEACSLEAFVRFALWTLARDAFLILVFRYVLATDVTHLPWRVGLP